MKTSAFGLTAFLSVGLLLSSCNNATHTPDPAATATQPGAPAADGMAGMDHAAMGHSAATGPAGTSPQLTAMTEMMQRMHATKPRGNTDYDFARHMLEHHRGAVVMADLELRDGQDPTMRRMAEKIKADQQKEIGELEASIARLANAPVNYQPTAPFARKMNASMKGMMQNMAQAGTNPDLNFNQLMTLHHQSAVDMARAELDHGQDSRLREMARQMMEAQQQEIKELKAWHAQNAGKL
ncbi:uncharacterized protein (DUF305 family) [Hymenobacter luteus]|uniref:Uncharacterized protein (DUF305 family) n=2 Tax=Hymenobacter TaxID=89966 RepID=A0A7W9T2Q6_9BACT|nr:MULTISPECIES: DUF305 domain-containing protein [Hymenobacter]MBB4601589.1 uncharacterized protein (DUF305 family) [Hymenobacter latericoloratus]MBB6059983.1 uncharacterized protein (DUF305 family) [Hymenobacter luteus]